VQLHDSEGRELFSSRFCSEPAVRAGDSHNKTLLLPFVSSGRTTPSVTARRCAGVPIKLMEGQSNFGLTARKGFESSRCGLSQL
jgi:hypothetical protein